MNGPRHERLVYQPPACLGGVQKYVMSKARRASHLPRHDDGVGIALSSLTKPACLGITAVGPLGSAGLTHPSYSSVTGPAGRSRRWTGRCKARPSFSTLGSSHQAMRGEGRALTLQRSSDDATAPWAAHMPVCPVCLPESGRSIRPCRWPSSSTRPTQDGRPPNIGGGSVDAPLHLAFLSCNAIRPLGPGDKTLAKWGASLSFPSPSPSPSDGVPFTYKRLPTWTRSCQPSGVYWLSVCPSVCHQRPALGLAQ
ncbi:hypothetical protein F5X68DRAFT_42374 [Plectosphaerella plurivora]|uniref:Uncharacterized protein n=1 Tax=Plectosphaerella plurivora TaxID=936078 RepID=A0A9P8V4Q0_9PEZI|nr:hypothetical protein F5X68DRAFT_42374 [Plectosphaerella plurivora]